MNEVQYLFDLGTPWPVPRKVIFIEFPPSRGWDYFMGITGLPVASFVISATRSAAFADMA
jgi:hypothetical protein